MWVRNTKTGYYQLGNAYYSHVRNNIDYNAIHTLFKLHISVAKGYKVKARNAIAHLLEALPQFKVTARDEKEEAKASDRYSEGAQFTLYIYQTKRGIPLLPIELWAELIDKITSVLESNNIPPGVKPQSDLATISPYFSLRCDRDLDLGYIHADKIRACPNPCNWDLSFYASLLKEPYFFSIVEHFKSLPLDANHIKSSIQFALEGCFNQFLDTEAPRAILFTLLAEEKYACPPLPAEYFRKEYQDQCAEVTAKLVQLFIIMYHAASPFFNPLKDDLQRWVIIEDEQLNALFAAIKVEQARLAMPAKTAFAESKTQPLAKIKQTQSALPQLSTFSSKKAFPQAAKPTSQNPLKNTAGDIQSALTIYSSSEKPLKSNSYFTP